MISRPYQTTEMVSQKKHLGSQNRLTSRVNYGGREDSKAHGVGDGVGGAQEQGRVRLILGLVECTVGDDLRDIVR